MVDLDGACDGAWLRGFAVVDFTCAWRVVDFVGMLGAWDGGSVSLESGFTVMVLVTDGACVGLGTVGFAVGASNSVGASV